MIIRNIVLVSDSTYVVQSMTNWILNWRKNGWTNRNGRPLGNQRLLQELDAVIGNAEQSGINVLFWQVPRQYIPEADSLAKNGSMLNN
jgi:ribonuclease HI